MIHKIIHNDCLNAMREMEDNSIDFIVTDSPYGISFMSKKWDQKIPPIEYWKEMLRICKPGSYMACAGLPRMMHRLTSIVEDSGWIIRDMIIHIFGSGFPKSNNFGKKLGEPWNGYGTALKPAWEGWTLAMKPLDGTFAHNAEKWGVGGINIESSRVGVSQHEKGPVPSICDNEFFSSLESCRNVLSYISFALLPCNTIHKDYLHNVLYQDGNLKVAEQYENLLTHLYPNGVWCGLKWSLIADSQSDCPIYRHLYDELLPHALKNAEVSAPLLLDVLVYIYQYLFSPSNNHGICNDHPSILDVLDLLRAFLKPLFNPILYLSQTNKSSGRWPSNLILSEESAEQLDEMTGILAGAGNKIGSVRKQNASFVPNQSQTNFKYDNGGGASRFFKVIKDEKIPTSEYEKTENRRFQCGLDLPSYKTFFYCAKASSSERNKGLDKPCSHPTVKPLSLMKYIIKLLAPPGNPILLDPFCGSGSTICAAKELGISAIGIEKEKEYVEIASKRLDAAIYSVENQMEMF